jgi:hypothetical protein
MYSKYTACLGRQNSSVGVVSRLLAGRPKDGIKAVSGAHPASYSLGSGAEVARE